MVQHHEQEPVQESLSALELAKPSDDVEAAIEKQPSVDDAVRIETLAKYLVEVNNCKNFSLTLDQAINIVRNQEHTTWPEFVVSSCVTFLLCWTYFFGLIMGARVNLYWEATISLGMPVLLFQTGFIRLASDRLQQLMRFESLYNFISIIAKLSIMHDVPWLNDVCVWAYVAFFSLQVFGFVAKEVENKYWWGMVSSITMAISIIMFKVNTGTNPNRMDDENRLLMWGEEAPVTLRLNYIVWVINVMLFEFIDIGKHKMTHPIAHFASVAIACWVGEFWHARLLTACHVFFISALTGSSYNVTHVQKDFASLPVQGIAWQLRLQKPITVVTCIGCLVVCTTGLACGQDTLLCADYPF